MNGFYRPVLVVSLLCLFASSVLAQRTAATVNPCNLPLNQAPELWGFKLGMTLEQIRERYPSIRVNPSPSFSLVEADVYASEDSKTQRNYKWMLLGVYTVKLSFIDQKLSYIGIAYNPQSFTYSSLDGYTSMLSKSYDLPNGWKLKTDSDFDNDIKEMKCGDVDFYAFTSPAVALLMFDSKAFNALDQRIKDYQKRQYDRFLR